MKQFEFTTLKLFLAVADCGSLTTAADLSNIAIAALSKRISDMETAAGIRFFERRARGMSLTSAGRALLPQAREIIYGVERMQSDMQLYARGIHGTLRIAATASAVAQFLPDEVRAFSATHPSVAIDLSEGTSQSVVAAVLDGRVDVGIFIDSTPESDLAIFPYQRDELCVVVPQGHELCSRARVRLVETLQYDQIGTQMQSSLSQKLMAEGGADYRVRIRVGSVDAACRMVQAGLGICVAPRLIVQSYLNCFAIALVKLEEPWARRQLLVGVRSRQGLSGAAEAFLHRCIEAGTARRSQPPKTQVSPTANDLSHDVKHAHRPLSYDASLRYQDMERA